MTAVKPPLGLVVEIADANGVRTRWNSEDRYPGNRPQNLSFSTRRGEGFADASVMLARRIDRDYVDLHLFDDVWFVGMDGSIAYEGRVAAQPRSVQAAHSISVACAGHMAHTRDRPFTEIYVDRDPSAWQPASRARQISLVSGNRKMGGQQSVTDAGGAPAIQLQISDSWVSPFTPIAESLYDAGPNNTIASLYYWLRGTAGASATFEFYFLGGSTDSIMDITSGDAWAGTDVASYLTLTGPRRYVSLEWLFPTTPAGSQGQDYSIFAANLTMYGNHGLPLYGTDPMGVYASDVIRNVTNRFCPNLNVTGVQDTFWPIPHLVFKEPTDPYDAFLAVNKYHLWEIGVWENKTLTYEPADRSDYTWEVRLGDPGVQVSLQGDSTEELANGIVVDYTDVATGQKDTLTPDVYADLVDTDPDNVVSLHGLNRWTKLSLSSPTTQTAALQIGRAALAEFNAPKAPGTITLQGHVRDRAGHWQQGWKVRAGHTLSITDHPNDSPRLITETNWDHDSKQLTVTVDGHNPRIDAVLDRIGTALNAAGLS